MNNKTRGAAVLLAAVMQIWSLSGCGTGEAVQSDASGTNSAASSTQSNGSLIATGTAVSAADIDIEFSARDLEVGYEDSQASHITLNGSGASVSGSGVTVSGSIITISAEGTYVFSGTLNNGHIIVDAPDTDKVQIVFNGVTIHCEDYAPVYIKQADKVFLTLAQGTENSLSDGGAYILSDEDSNVDGVIFSKADLTINGSGSLNVTAAYKHGIVSKDDLVVTGGEITVTAQGGGLYGKDCVKIADGTLVLNTQSDGIQSDNAEDSSKGYVYIAGGSFDIIAGTDGIQAETVLRVDNGNIKITTGGGSANASTDANGDARNGWGNWGTAAAADNTTDTASAKGLKAGSELIVNSGTIAVDSSDDSLHSNGSLTIAGGTLSLASGDDGIHADAAAVISNGTVNITKSYEGLEGSSITISGGKLTLTASDDGLNAAGGNDSSSMGGRPGQNNFSANTDVFIRITGGTVQVNASGDGLDSNGALYVEGGEVYVSGPTGSGNGALDYDSEGTISGGVIVAAGSSGMVQGFTTSSTQCSLLYNFSSAVSAGTAVTLTDKSGNVVTSFTPEKAYQSVVISSSALIQGETYTLTAGNQTASVTLTSISTSNGSAGGGGMGGMPGGQQGGQQGGKGPGGR